LRREEEFDEEPSVLLLGMSVSEGRMRMRDTHLESDHGE
jgi:hypothetical protein